MPILQIEVVGARRKDLAPALAAETAAAIGVRPGGCWVRLRYLNPRDYAENGPGVGLPVFVSVLKRNGLGDEREAMALASAVARVVDRPVEQVHVLYEGAARGRIFFGGKRVE